MNQLKKNNLMHLLNTIKKKITRCEYSFKNLSWEVIPNK